MPQGIFPFVVNDPSKVNRAATREDTFGMTRSAAASLESDFRHHRAFRRPRKFLLSDLLRISFNIRT